VRRKEHDVLMATYYKVLRRHADGTLRSCHGGNAVWPEPKRIGYATYQPGAVLMAHAPPRLRTAGVHLTTRPVHWLTVIGAEYYVAEPVGPRRDGSGDLSVFDGARLIEPVELPFWWQEVEAFVASIPATPWMQRVAPPRPEWNVSPTMACARTRATARAGAIDSVADRILANARADAGVRATNANRGRANDRAGDAAWANAVANRCWHSATAGASARDAAFLAQSLCCGGLPLDPEASVHAHARWDVWQRGYGLSASVAGVLYVYEAIA
jgi:hypothetical protein